MRLVTRNLSARFEQRGIGARELACLAEVLARSLESLFADHCTPVAFHSCIVGRNQLRGQHTLKLVSRPDANECRKSRALLLSLRFIA